MLEAIPVRHLFTYTAEVEPRYMANSSGSMDLLLRVVSGHFEGERLRGTLLADFCSDNGVVRPSGAIRSEVHLLLETDDGEQIHMNYQANTLPHADGRFTAYNFPFFETGSEKYSWLNRVQALTVYRFGDGPGDAVYCDVYALEAPERS